MWEINNTAQAISFFYSLLLGMIFCLLYDLLRVWRAFFHLSDIVIFFQDIIYFIVISFVTFIFMIPLTNGEIRGYIIVGIFLGFCICFFTVSRFVFEILKFIFSKIKGFFKCLFKFFYTNFAKADNFIAEKLKKLKNCCKKGLKKVKRMLYTKEQSS